ncbi:CotO family spore coat protein [Bacillus spongiae]|uniref:CotO family spore coat protein n=2 Tax=Bacillus spongiae TaxID=2683610 RepID=A0ABU8HBF4_9BACI
MREKTECKREPLLYVQQPDFHPKEIKMQSVYSSKQPRVKLERAGKKENQRDKRKLHDVHRLIGKDLLKGTKTDIELQKTQESSSQPTKPFTKMNIEEKLQHLNRFKYGKAPFPCEFLINNKIYRGVLVKYDGETIELKPFQGKQVLCKRKELKEIHLIGLTKNMDG